MAHSQVFQAADSGIVRDSSAEGSRWNRTICTCHRIAVGTCLLTFFWRASRNINYTHSCGTMHSYIEGVQAGKLRVEMPHRIVAQLRTPGQRQLGDVSSQHGAHEVYRVIAQTLPAADSRRCVRVCVRVCVCSGQCSSGKSGYQVSHKPNPELTPESETPHTGPRDASPHARAKLSKRGGQDHTAIEAEDGGAGMGHD